MLASKIVRACICGLGLKGVITWIDWLSYGLSGEKWAVQTTVSWTSFNRTETNTLLIIEHVLDASLSSSFFFIDKIISVALRRTEILQSIFSTACHDGLDEILSHHFFTCGRDSIRSPSPSLNSILPHGRWNRSANVNVCPAMYGCTERICS